MPDKTETAGPQAHTPSGKAEQGKSLKKKCIGYPQESSRLKYQRSRQVGGDGWEGESDLSRGQKSPRRGPEDLLG